MVQNLPVALKIPPIKASEVNMRHILPDQRGGHDHQRPELVILREHDHNPVVYQAGTDPGRPANRQKLDEILRYLLRDSELGLARVLQQAGVVPGQQQQHPARDHRAGDPQQLALQLRQLADLHVREHPQDINQRHRVRCGQGEQGLHRGGLAPEHPRVGPGRAPLHQLRAGRAHSPQEYPPRDPHDQLYRKA